MKRSQMLLLLVALVGSGVLGGLAVQYKDVLWKIGTVAMAAVARDPHKEKPFIKKEAISQTAGVPSHKSNKEAGHQDYQEEPQDHHTAASGHDHPESAHSPGAETEGEHQHGEHGGHADHTEEQLIRLSLAKQQALEITVSTANSGKLQQYLTLPGEVTLNADRLARIVSRLPGVVQQVSTTVGELVRAGEIMAVIDSRELADLKATYLAARENLVLSEATFRREANLWQQKITAEQDYLDAKQDLAKTQIALRTAEQQLQALGFAKASLAALPAQAATNLTRYAITAPFDGTVIEKHLTLGTVLKDDTAVFVVADLRTVWVDLNIPTNDLPLVRKGQRVVISAGNIMPPAEGTISYVSSIVSGDTRTAVTRVVLQNQEGRWRPGLFVTATIAVRDTPVALAVPKTALQTVDGQPNLFIQMPEGFVPRPVTLGRDDQTHVEITAGLQAGERYAATETFVLKAELGKGTASHEH